MRTERHPRSAFLAGLRLPLLLAPMAGGPSTPGLAAAVAESGAGAFLAAGYRSPAQLAADVEALRSQSGRAFGVNLFVPTPRTADPGELAAYARRMEAAGHDPGEPRWDDDGWEAKLELILDLRPAVASFTFGCPPQSVLEDLGRAGIEAWVTVTEPDEAARAAELGASGLVVQGLEAGGHRGTWTDRDGAGEIGLLALLRLVAARTDLPLIAAGGIADGYALAAVVAAGAAAAQAGTAFLGAREAGTWAGHRQALSEAARPTGLTRAFSGRRARGLVNRFMTEHSAAAPVAYPEVHHLTTPIRAAARAAGDAERVNLWAGQAYPLARIGQGAADIVEIFADQYRSARERLRPI